MFFCVLFFELFWGLGGVFLAPDEMGDWVAAADIEERFLVLGLATGAISRSESKLLLLASFSLLITIFEVAAAANVRTES